MRTDWGCPSGLSADDYVGADGWRDDRWRWEFKRRQDEVRLKYHILANDEYRENHSTDTIPKDIIWEPAYREVYFFLSPGDAATIGFSVLCNPLYSERIVDFSKNTLGQFSELKQRTISSTHFWQVKYRDADEFSSLGQSQVAIAFDPDRSIARQMENLEEYIRSLRHHSVEQELLRMHPSKWLVYLRMLDARKFGASWNDCATEVLPTTNAQTPQSARDAFQQARRLQDSL